MKRTIQETRGIYSIANQIIDYSFDNTAGTVMSTKLIVESVKLFSDYLKITPNANLTIRLIELVLHDTESEEGYLVKHSDFLAAFLKA